MNRTEGHCLFTLCLSLSLNRYQNLLQISLAPSEVEKISDTHSKLLRVSLFYYNTVVLQIRAFQLWSALSVFLHRKIHFRGGIKKSYSSCICGTLLCGMEFTVVWNSNYRQGMIIYFHSLSATVSAPALPFLLSFAIVNPKCCFLIPGISIFLPLEDRHIFPFLPYDPDIQSWDLLIRKKHFGMYKWHYWHIMSQNVTWHKHYKNILVNIFSKFHLALCYRTTQACLISFTSFTVKSIVFFAV